MAAHGDVHIEIPAPPGDDDFVAQGGQQQQQHVGGVNIPPPFAAPQWWLPPWIQQPHVHDPAAEQPHKVKLSSFWTHQPRVWFGNAEALFATYNVVNQRTKFHLVLPQLSESTLIRVAAIVNAPHLLANPYDALRARLLEVYEPDIWEQAANILHYRELGEMRPSQLMDELLALLPPGELPGILFKQVFMGRLPSDVRAHVRGAAQHQDCRQLAAAADTIWLARNQPKTPYVAAATVDDLSDAVAAVRVSKPSEISSKPPHNNRGKQQKNRGRGGNRSNVQAAPSRTQYLCYKHARFGDQAWQCEDPGRCTASSPGAQGN